MGRQGRRHKQLLDDHNEMSGPWKLKEKALVCTLWRTCFAKGYGPLINQTAICVNELMNILVNVVCVCQK
jgi:hypothetical protein